MTPAVRILTWLACACALASLSCSRPRTTGVTTVASALYARSDTNATTVWAPRLRVAGKLGESAGLETAVAMDAWTGASIDVTTAATKAIHEVRKEFTAGGYYEFPNATISGGYRYSTENDYWSNGGVGTLSFDMASKNTNLAFSGFGSKDTVGRSHDPDFKQAQNNVGGRLTLTQILNMNGVMQLSWETTRVRGYQASPYRYVAIGGQGTCASLAPLCVPETVPNERFRSAAIARAKYALGDHVSIGAEYRYYFDNWAVRSQTIAPQLNWLMTEHATLNLSYRYYTQGEARFYQPRYLDPMQKLDYVTRDRELSAMYSQRIGLGVERAFELGEEGNTVLLAALRTGVTRFRYLAFVGLESVTAYEGTFLLSLDFR